LSNADIAGIDVGSSAGAGPWNKGIGDREGGRKEGSSDQKQKGRTSDGLLPVHVVCFVTLALVVHAKYDRMPWAGWLLSNLMDDAMMHSLSVGQARSKHKQQAAAAAATKAGTKS